MKQPVLARPGEGVPSLDGDCYFVVIATWDDVSDTQLTIQDFVRNEERFIPVFSDEAHFTAEVAGSGFEGKGVLIRKDFLRSMLTDDQALILNPGSDAIRLRRDQIR